MPPFGTWTSIEASPVIVSRHSQGPVTPSELAAALREARTARDLGLEEAARACMLSDVQAAGLESGDYHAFYSREYARRAAQRYAAFLGLAALARDLETGEAGPVPAAAAPAPADSLAEHGAMPASPRRPPSSGRAMLAAGLIGVLMVAFLLRPDRAPEQMEPPAAGGVEVTPAPGEQGAGPRAEVGAKSPPPAAAVTPAEPAARERASAAAAVPAGQQAVPATPGAAAAQARPRRSPRRFYVLALSATPLRIQDGTGRSLYSGNVQAGFSRNFEGDPPFLVEAKAPDPLEMYYLGRRVRLKDVAPGQAAARFGEPVAAQ